MKKYGGKYPLIVEPHPNNYKGYDFITLIKYNDTNYLNIIDNVCNKQIITYVLDLCGPSNVKEDLIIQIAQKWFIENRNNYPISIEFSKLNISAQTSSILRYFPIDYVTRVIGPLPEYNMAGPFKVKKRKRKLISKNMEYINKSSKSYYD